MGLKKVLRTLKLIEIDEPDPASRAAPPPAGNDAGRLDEILAAVEPAPEINASRVRSQAGGLVFPPFAEVYAAAGIPEPSHGFSAFKVLEILQASELVGLEPKAKAAALLGFLKMNPKGPVAIADVVQDAVRRDQALDKYEELLRAKHAERAAALATEHRALEAEIEEYVRRNRGRIDQDRRALDDEYRRLEEWTEKKRAEERRLAAAVEPFVQGSPIST